MPDLKVSGSTLAKDNAGEGFWLCVGGSTHMHVIFHLLEIFCTRQVEVGLLSLL